MVSGKHRVVISRTYKSHQKLPRKVSNRLSMKTVVILRLPTI